MLFLQVVLKYSLNLSDAFPIIIGSCEAACCNIVINTPRRIAFLIEKQLYIVYFLIKNVFTKCDLPWFTRVLSSANSTSPFNITIK